MNRKQIVIGNWKMYKTIPEAIAFVEKIAPLLGSSQDRAYLAVPYTAIAATAEIAEPKGITVGAQNMNDASEGAFTGEIAGKMLVDAGAKFVILGHSERRHVFQESCAFISRKVRRALADGLEVVLCVGETCEEREAGNTDSVVRRQLFDSLEEVKGEQLAHLRLAYEPVWAIGTGHTATPEQAQEVHACLRQAVGETWGEEIGGQLGIVYGGSVKPANAGFLMTQPDIDGVLVGGASLDPQGFSQILHSTVR